MRVVWSLVVYLGFMSLFVVWGYFGHAFISHRGVLVHEDLVCKRPSHGGVLIYPHGLIFTLCDIDFEWNVFFFFFLLVLQVRDPKPWNETRLSPSLTLVVEAIPFPLDSRSSLFFSSSSDLHLWIFFSKQHFHALLHC